MSYIEAKENGGKVEDLFYKYSVGAKPFLKWVGGKRQLLAQFENLYPKELKQKTIKNYYEPFVGGGAVFYDVAQNYEVKNAFLYDINDELIISYKVIQKDVAKLLECLHRYDKIYKQLSEKKQQEFYYDTRHKYNLDRSNNHFEKYEEKWIPRVAQTIFLNKTCFNGLFRFNSKGDFNTPHGKYTNPNIIDEPNLLKVSKLLEIATIKKADFREVIHDVKDNSFLYFDPPYRPISKSASFTAYNKSGFSDNEQFQLAELFIGLDKFGHKLMLSNSDPKNLNADDNFFDSIYSNFKISRVEAKRSISSDGTKRNLIKEIVVTNY
jgi:DNA adenine methylase